jgi:hypothetical protein
VFILLSILTGIGFLGALVFSTAVLQAWSDAQG